MEYFCTNCDSHVANKSKHCKRCERCVSQFDHHCKWVNNCIGGKNYKLFLSLIISVFFSCGIFCFIVAFFTKIFFSTEEKSVFIKNSGFFIANEEVLNILMGFLWAFGGITAIFVVLDFNLIVFHLWLIKKKISTYDYIIEKRKQKSQLVKNRFFNEFSRKNEKKPIKIDEFQ